MKHTFRILSVFIALIISAQTWALSTVKIGITEDLLKKYNTFLNGRSVYDIEKYDGNGARRSVIEVVLLLQSLKSGGLDAQVEWIVLPNSARINRSLRNGSVALSASSLWNYDLPDLAQYANASTAIVAEGEYQAGLFKVSTNPLTISSADDLANLSAISVSKWIPDWTTLASLPLKNVIDVNNWATMVRMIGAGRADIMLSSFKSSDDMGFTEGENRFVPVQGVKVSLIGSRHYAVSKFYTDSPEIFMALNKGIKNLRNNGVIHQAFTESGFFNPRVQNWKDIRLE